MNILYLMNSITVSPSLCMYVMVWLGTYHYIHHFDIIMQDQSTTDDQEESSCTIFEGYLQKEGKLST